MSMIARDDATSRGVLDGPKRLDVDDDPVQQSWADRLLELRKTNQ